MGCAIGLRAHSGWAAAVAVTLEGRGGASEPAVLLRERVEMTDPGLEGAKAPYHAAERLDPGAAAEFLRRCEAASAALARVGLRGLLDRLRSAGHAASRCALLTGAGRPLPELEVTLASHALIHVGDGEHFRKALAAAAEDCGLALVRVREREVAASLGASPEAVDAFLARQRKALGPPWTQDQKLATLAAWHALRV
jgi:hypothetical protein